jgi:serine protease Do
MRLLLPFASLLAAAAALTAVGAADLVPPPKAVTDAEAARVAVIDRVRPAVVAVCYYGGEACGSGVMIDPEGYALTNFHVVQPTGNVLQCGLPDGLLYDAVVVGTDKVGDVALVKMLPRVPGKPFPFAPLGDSDRVRAGQWSLAMGNPFGLSLDFTPTVTFGLVSGVNRYQPPEGKGTLEYTDCIQIDTSINPGNSGGPLFNMEGELIGINGRGSFEKRGRVNSGVGYAISVNQIKNFLGHLKAGLDTDHATLGALVQTETEDGDLGRIVVKQILDDSDAARRGVQAGDQLVSFAGRHLGSTNQYKNILGIFPKGWRLPLSYRHDNVTKEVLVRLMGNIDTPINNAAEKPAPGGAPPGPKRPGMAESPAHKLFIKKAGFANYYFNKLRQDALHAETLKAGDFTAVGGPWAIDGTIELADRRGDVKVTMAEGSDGLTVAKISRNGIEDAVNPLKPDAPLGELQLPQGSGGMLVALTLTRRLLTQWDGGFEIGFSDGGHEPFYPPAAAPPKGEVAPPLAASRVDCEVIRGKHGPFDAKFYYALKGHTLLGCEVTITEQDDPCELYFSDYKPVDGRSLPHKIEVRTGDRKYATLTVKSYTLGKKVR